MIIETEGKNDIELELIDKDNQIYIDITRDYDCIYTWLNINQAKQLINFLQEQVETFNNK